MFWHAVLGGLQVLLHWQAWIAMLLYGLLLFIPMAAIGAAAERDMRLGCVGMLVLPLFQVFASMVVLWTLLPIILGLSNDALWALPWSLATGNPVWMLKVTLMLALFAILSAIVPILGRMTSFSNFIVGSGAIAVATREFAAASGREALTHIRYVPSFWTSIGFVIVGAIAATVAGLSLTAVSMAINRSVSNEEYKPGPLLVSAFGIIGLIPAFMYGTWLGDQVKAVLP